MAKKSYTVACPGALAQGLAESARARGCNVADLVRSVLLLMSSDALAALPDPGEPGVDDREPVTSGAGAGGRSWRRKPRLQVRLPDGFSAADIRRAAAFALALGQGRSGVAVGASGDRDALETARADLERSQAALAALMVQPLPNGVRSRDDALHVMGFPPRAMPERPAVRARYRLLAPIYHPDSATGDHGRMSQLNAALEWLDTGTPARTSAMRPGPR
jgi:hypothetical protein